MNKNLKAYFCLLGGLSFMCFAAIFLKSAHAPGIVTAFHRMAIGTIILIVPFLISLKRSKKKLPIKGVLFAAIGGFCFACDMALWSTGVVMSNATIPTLMANLAPLWVGFGTMLIFGQRHKSGFWIGLLIAISGMFILIHNDMSLNSKVGMGALLGLFAGFFYGIFYMVSELGRKLIDTLHFLFIFTFSSAIILTIFMLIFGYNFTGYDRYTYLMFLGMGIIVQVCGWFLINYSQGFLPASIVAPTLLGQPVLTAFLAVLLLNEHLTVWHWSGGAVVVLGIYIVHFNRQKS
jgi:drug/metabolite transporter (DMT)-like permease